VLGARSAGKRGRKRDPLLHDLVAVRHRLEYGVLVSSYVASGATAKVPVPYGTLKSGVLYKVRTSAFDGSLYETTWPPWADFRIEPYVKFPAAQTSSTSDTTAQENIEVTRTDPGPALPTLDANGAVKREATQERTYLRQAGYRGPQDLHRTVPSRQGRKHARRNAPRCCTRRKRRRPERAVTFDFEQRIKTYPNKGADGTNFRGVRPADPYHAGPDLPGAEGCHAEVEHPTDVHGVCHIGDSVGRRLQQCGGRQRLLGRKRLECLHRRRVGYSRDKERIDLGWSVTASVDANGTATVTAV
jgi:hypothetical protein